VTTQGANGEAPGRLGKARGRLRRVFRVGAWALGARPAIVVVGAIVYALAFLPRYPVKTPTIRIDPTPDRVARGKALANVLACVQCHADPAAGDLTGRALKHVPAVLSPGAASANITGDRQKGIGG